MIKPVTGISVGITSALLNNWSIALFNVPITVIGMAAAGSILSFAYEAEGSKPKMTRKKMYFLAVANTVLASAAVAVLPSWLGWTWVSKGGMEGSLALLVAASARFVIPAILSMPKELLSKFFGIGKYYKGYNSENTGASDEESDK